jgi:hypothetical protein
MSARLNRPIAWIALCAGFCFAGPARSVEKTGAITGTVDKPELVTAVTAVDRTSGDADKKYTGKFDPKTGQFTIEGLPLEATYDCVIDFAGARLEGVNLKAKRSDYEEEQPLVKEDVETIKNTVLSLNKFEDKVEVLAVRGNIQHAAVVVNKLRTRPFINSNPGEVVWRLELWHFERPEETWVKEQDELFLVLHRERIQKADFDKKSLTLDPALGGLQPKAKQPAVDLGQVKLPSKEPGIRLRPEKTDKPGTGKGG